MYINGILKDSTVFNQNIQYNNTPYFYIGTNIEGQAFGYWKVRDFIGLIDEIKITKVALQPSQFNMKYISALPSLLDFGFVEVGKDSMQEVRLYNTSLTDTIHINNVIFSNDNFMVSGTPDEILPQSNIVLGIKYVPTSYQVDVGTVEFNYMNDEYSTTRLDLYGKGYFGNIDTNVVAYWRFEENEGNVLHDASVYHNDGTIGGNATWVKGKFGSGLHFDGYSSYVMLPNTTSLKQYKEFTVEAWFSLDTLGFPYDSQYPDKNRPIVDNMGAYPSGGGYSLQFNSVHGYSFSYRDNISSTNFSRNINLFYPYHFYHAAAVYQRINLSTDSFTVVKVYLDGELRDSSVFSRGIQYSNTPYMYLGTNVEGQAFGYWKVRDFVGILDEIKITKVALNPEEFGVTCLVISEPTIDFGFIKTGETLTKIITLKNTSYTDTLVVNSIGILNPNFKIEPSTFELLPQSQKEISVTYQPAGEGVDELKVTFFAEDSLIESSDLELKGRSYSLKEMPMIISVKDIPNDQGRQVRLLWYPSKYDAPDAEKKVIEYSIWRKVDDISSLTIPADVKNGSLFGLRGRQLRMINGELLDYVTMLPAVQFEQYATVVPTLYNTTVYGIRWSTFRIAAHTIEGDFYFSDPDSGYSLDNEYPFSPGVLVAFQAGTCIRLTWDASASRDVLEYNVYRSVTEDFEPSEESRISRTCKREFTDSLVVAGVEYYYAVTAVDSNWNESQAVTRSTGLVVTGIPGSGEIPKEYFLAQNYPNPFNPTTVISYDLPERSRVILAVYDMMGREVGMLVDEVKDAGSYKAVWNYTQASGVYFYKIIASGIDNSSRTYTCVHKMILIK